MSDLTLIQNDIDPQASEINNIVIIVIYCFGHSQFWNIVPFFV